MKYGISMVLTHVPVFVAAWARFFLPRAPALDLILAVDDDAGLGEGRFAITVARGCKFIC
jgi:hypothetical protein